MDISGIVRFVCMIFIVIFHMRGFYTNEAIESLYQIPFLGQILLNGSYVNQFFFTLSGYVISKNYKEFKDRENNFLGKHYKKFVGLSILTLPAGLLFHYLYYHENVNFLGCILDILLIRTGYGIGDGNPYNQPLWFLNVLFLMYIVYYFIMIFFKNVSNYVIPIIVIFCAAAIHGGIQIGLPDTRVIYALFAFFSGSFLCIWHDNSEETKKADRLGFTVSFSFILLLITEILMEKDIYVIYSTSDVWIVLQIFLWCPIVFVCTSTYCKKKIFQKIFRFFERISGSIFIWHYPLIYFLIIGFRRFGFDSGNIIYTIGQLFIIICASIISSYVFEPKMNKYIRSLTAK